MTTERVLDDRYELVELVGSGGMAEVWRARDRRLGRDVAVKLLPGPAAREESRRRRIEREAKALAAANHPNIVAVYDYGEEPAANGGCLPFIVMELVDGPDLHRYLSERGPLPLDDARGIMSGVLAAVERAHAVGVVHGDLKPGNVFIGSHGPKVGDFGVARILGEETGTTTVAATPSFAAPEVLRGERAAPSSDVYSAACLAYELLAGRAPYDGANGWEIAQKHLESPSPRVRKVRSDVPAELDAAITRGMDKRPHKRFASAAAFAAALGSSAADVAASGHEASRGDVDRTVPVTGPTTGRTDATEVIDGGPRADPARLALLGPLARLGTWWNARRERGRVRTGSAAGRWSPLIAGLAAVVLVSLIGTVLLRDRDPERVAVPEVVGRTLVEGTTVLRADGFRVDVSYRPVTEGQAGLVLETIPAADELLEPNSRVHVIASAFEATPQPVVERSDDDGGGDEGKGDEGKGRDRSNGRDEKKGRGKGVD